MRRRHLFLLSPDGADGGGGTTTVAVSATEAGTKTGASGTATSGTTVTAPQIVSMSAEEYRRHVDNENKLREFEATKAAELETERQKSIKTLAEKEGVEAALKQEREDNALKLQQAELKAANVERERLNDKLSEAIANALIGTDFLSNAAAQQAKEQLEKKFEAVRDSSGHIVVREKGTLKPVGEVAKAWLESLEGGAHFLKATSRGGSGSKGSDRPAPDKTDTTLRADEIIVNGLKARQAAAPKRHYGLGSPPPKK